MLKGFLYAPVKLTPEQIHHVEEKFSESLQDQEIGRASCRERV